MANGDLTRDQCDRLIAWMRGERREPTDDAFAALHRLLTEFVRSRFVKTGLASRHDGEEAVMSVFLNLVEKPAPRWATESNRWFQEDSPRRLIGQFRRAVRNKVFDLERKARGRSQKRERPVSLEDKAGSLRDDLSADPSKQTVANVLHRVREAIEARLRRRDG